MCESLLVVFKDDPVIIVARVERVLTIPTHDKGLDQIVKLVEEHEVQDRLDAKCQLGRFFIVVEHPHVLITTSRATPSAELFTTGSVKQVLLKFFCKRLGLLQTQRSGLTN